MGQAVTYDWPKGWHGLNGTEARALKAEVFREINGVHALAGRAFEVIGRSDTGDDVVLAVAGFETPFATLHLEWPAERGALQRMFGAIPRRPVPALSALRGLNDLPQPLG